MFKKVKERSVVQINKDNVKKLIKIKNKYFSPIKLNIIKNEESKELYVNKDIKQDMVLQHKLISIE